MTSPRRDPQSFISRVFLVLACGFLAIAPAFAASQSHVLHRFRGEDGQFPYYGNLTFDAAGNLYGTTYNGGDFGGGCNYGSGCGSVFKLTLRNDKWTWTVLHKFQNDGQDGYYPLGALAIDTAGNLYGTTTQGGTHQAGTVFMLAPNGDVSYSETVIYSFCSAAYCLDGGGPEAGLILDAAGDLYGTTSWGGNVRGGVVFKLARGTQWKEKVLYSLVGSYEGGSYAGLTFDKAGNLYGTTNGGSCFASGTVFKLSPRNHDEWYYTLLHKFSRQGKDGACPFSGVTLDPQGNVYGTTVGGGAYDAGIVYQLIPQKRGVWKEIVLHNFNFNDGAEPYAGLVRDASGNLYGTLTAGGKNGLGSVFRLTLSRHAMSPDSATEKILFNFSGRDGIFPYAGLVFDANGNMYGATYYGGNLSDCNYQGCGVIFKLTP
jgi:uncharacterized repeat protein (TIGR03803 family)